MTLLISLFACRAEMPTTSNEDAGHDLDGTVATIDEEETSTDAPEKIVPEENTEPNCQFPTRTWRSGEEVEVVLLNEFEVTLNPDSPSGEKEPGWNDVLCLDYTVVHSECPAMSPSWHVINAVASDNEDSNWLQGVVNNGIYGYDENGEYVTGWDARNAPEIGEANNYNFGLSPFMPWIQGGETLTVCYRANLENPSVEWDDTIRFGFQVDQLGIYDGVTNANLFVDPVPGGTLTF